MTRVIKPTACLNYAIRNPWCSVGRLLHSKELASQSNHESLTTAPKEVHNFVPLVLDSEMVDTWKTNNLQKYFSKETDYFTSFHI